MRWWKKPWAQAVIAIPLCVFLLGLILWMLSPVINAGRDTQLDYEPLIGKSRSEATRLKGSPYQVIKWGDPQFPIKSLGKPRTKRTFQEVWVYGGRYMMAAYVYFDKSGTCFAIDVVGS